VAFSKDGASPETSGTSFETPALQAPQDEGFVLEAQVERASVAFGPMREPADIKEPAPSGLEPVSSKPEG
jgi:hypothetical protein